MSPTFFTRTLIVIGFFLVVVGFVFNLYSTRGVNSLEQCSFNEQRECELTKLSEFVSVEFLQKIELEEELKLNIITSSDLKIKQMWVQGVNMFMGKTAVLLNSTYKTPESMNHEALIFLGACSEPDMRWQLIIETENIEHETQSWFFNFTTHR